MTNPRHRLFSPPSRLQPCAVPLDLFLSRSSSTRSLYPVNKKCPSPTNLSRKEQKSHLLSYDVNFEERRDRQQYFYSRKTADLIIEAVLQHFDYDHERIAAEFVCLCAPSIAEIFYREYDISVTLLDVDDRFSFLPGFHYFDLLSPSISCPNRFSFVLFDPPYFGLPFTALSKSVSLISAPSARLLVGFLKRDERLLFDSFTSLKRTSAAVEYDRVKPSRWINYGIYSNCDLKGIRRVHDEKRDPRHEKKPKESTKKGKFCK